MYSIVLRFIIKSLIHSCLSFFTGSIYILKLILPILTTISKCFQAGVVSFAKIVPTLEYAKEQLNQIAATETPLTVLKQVNYVFLPLNTYFVSKKSQSSNMYSFWGNVITF